MQVPDWWTVVILILGAFRLWRLLSEDTLLDGPRRWLVRLPRYWEEGDAIPPEYRGRVAELINCPWCLGFWISLSLWGLWQLNEHWTTVLIVPFAISAGVGFARVNLDPPE